MIKMKRILSIILCFTFIFSLFTFRTFASGFENVGGWNESIYATWSGTGEIYYKKSSDSTYTKADSELIRNISGKNRIDIPGLLGNTQYDIKLISNGNEYVSSVTTKAYDRSGYAHFNYTEGVGAYKDDGTLKDNAIIVYVTDNNKDTVTIPGYEGYANGKGIGWILNNNRALITAVTSAHPLVIRFIGTVNPPQGLTGYNSTTNGGTEGDNGNMAIIKNAKNLTLEGIGYDATIEGWGISLFHSAAQTNGGKNYEVRNLTFKNYPEDALGIQGEMSGNNLTAPIERVWVHNNSFYSGYCANPTDSDKAQGDGSCDFKRGQYFTLSYNYFDSCKKTNLIGAGDDNLQFNLSYHHNWYKNCASRGPLVRQANIHIYNNYYQGSLSQCIDARANAYVLSEGNFFESSNRPYDAVSGAVIKAMGDTMYDCILEEGIAVTTVTDRTQKVSNSNKYPDFDTNSSIFYYDSANKKSNVSRLTNAVTAKAECRAYSGAMKETIVEPNIESGIKTSVANPVTVPYSIDFTTTDAGSKMSAAGISQLKGTNVVLDNIIYNLFKDFKSSGKNPVTVKEEGITFKLNTYADVTLKDGGGKYSTVISNENCEVLVNPGINGTATATLSPGIYTIESSKIDKEGKVASFSIKTASVIPSVTETTTQTTTQTTTKEPTTETTTNTDYLIGDADSNGIISAADAAFVLTKVLNTDFTLPVESNANYMDIVDLTQDNSLSAADAAQILNLVLNPDGN